MRSLLNKSYPEEFRVFKLAAPLEGHLMRLHWQTQKAFVFGTYVCEVTKIVQQVVRSGWVVVDAGAHVGYDTLLLAKQVGPAGKVIAFEPLAENCKVLRENVQLNGYANIVVENKAVVDRSGHVALARKDEDPLTCTASVADGLEAKVRAVSLDDYFAQFPDHRRVAFIKMDIEGAEEAALDGMTRLLGNDRPILLIEIHGFNKFGNRHPALMKVLKAGYKVQYLDKPSAQIHVLAEPTSQRGCG
jgi:FkbM family methyltransferase